MDNIKTIRVILRGRYRVFNVHSAETAEYIMYLRIIMRGGK